MNFAFMSFSTPELTLEQMLATARRFGYDGIEPRLDAQHAHGVEVAAGAAERTRIKKVVQQSGITMCCLATSLRYADPDTTDEMLKQTHERIDLAGDLEVPVIRVFGGVFPESIQREEAVKIVADSLGRVADHAAQRGVTLCMETHDHWCRPADVAAVMRRVNKPSVAVNWDIMHPVRMKHASIDESFQTLRPWIRHLHVHDGTGENLKLVPIGEGEIDHRRALELLTEMGYTGFVSGEWIAWEPYETHLPRELATLQRFARKGRQ